LALTTRTGWKDKGSTEFTPWEAAPDAPRHEPALLDLFPRSPLIPRQAQNERYRRWDRLW